MTQSAINSNKPVRQLKQQGIQAAIWRNPTEKGVFYNVTIERRYRDADGEWHTATSFGRDDLLVLAKVADLAHSEIIQLQQADRTAIAQPPQHTERRARAVARGSR